MRAGFQEIANGRKADIYIINTCTVTASADRKSRHFIHYAHRRNPKAKIMVTGCYTTLDSNRIAQIPGVTHIIKNQDRNKIIELLNGNNGLNQTGISNFFGHTRAFLKIQDGCDNFCAYCKVPLVRGPSRSRPLSEIAKEAERLVKNGFKEIVLCGICLGAYGKDLEPKKGLVDIIEALEGMDGLLRIRLSSIEAGDVTDGLLDKMAQSRKLCRHLHIPMQSGDNKILKKMNRKFSRQDYANLVRKIKRRIPQIAITTDVMVGFPGENEINFRNTVGLIKKIIPLRAHIFPYSPRPGTAAYNLKDTVSPNRVKERMLRLQNIARTLSLAYKRRFINKDMDMLVEGRSKENKEYWEGHTDNYIKAMIKSGCNLRNQVVRVRLKKVDKGDVLADFC